MKKNTVRFLIKDCDNCPFVLKENHGRGYEYECAIGIMNRLDENFEAKTLEIAYSKPVTPDWCPLKVSNISVVFKK